MRTANRVKFEMGPQGGLSRGAPTIAALVLGLCLTGCAMAEHATDAIQPPPINPSSPIAGYAEQVSKETFSTPNFRQVPPKPIDVRSPAAYKTAVIDEIAMRRELAQWRATHPDLASDTEAWADLQRHRIPPSAGAPVSPTQDAESEAFAKRLREEADKSHPQP